LAFNQVRTALGTAAHDTRDNHFSLPASLAAPLARLRFLPAFPTSRPPPPPAAGTHRRRSCFPLSRTRSSLSLPSPPASDRTAGARIRSDGAVQARGRGRAAPAHGARQGRRGGGLLRVHRQA
jgi:hypothetical protein